jgi:DNA-binding beta-propeller fold protein YncE
MPPQIYCPRSCGRKTGRVVRRGVWIAGFAILLASASSAAEHLYAWVASGKAERVEVLDLTTGEILTSFDLDVAPTHLSLTPDLEYLYVSCRGDGQTRVLRPFTGNPVKRLPYVHPVFNARDSVHYYAPGLGGVFRYEVDGYSFEQLAYLPDTQNSFAYAVSADARWFIYAQHFVDWRGQGITDAPVYERVTVCNLEESTGQYVALGAEPLCVTISPRGDYAAVGCVSGEVSLIALGEEPTVTRTVELTDPVRFVGFTPDGGEMLFTSRDSIFTTRTDYPDEPPESFDLQSIPLGGAEIVDGAVTPDGDLVVVDGAGTLSLVNLNDDKVTLSLAVEPGTNDIIVAVADKTGR